MCYLFLHSTINFHCFIVLNDLVDNLLSSSTSKHGMDSDGEVHAESKSKRANESAFLESAIALIIFKSILKASTIEQVQDRLLFYPNANHKSSQKSCMIVVDVKCVQ